MRKLAKGNNLVITIAQNGDQFSVKEPSLFRNRDHDFTLGMPFDFAMADGTEVSVSTLYQFNFIQR